MIVLGTHGRTGLTRLLMGSVAEAIVRRAPARCSSTARPRTRRKLAAPQEPS